MLEINKLYNLAYCKASTFSDLQEEDQSIEDMISDEDRAVSESDPNQTLVVVGSTVLATLLAIAGLLGVSLVAMLCECSRRKRKISRGRQEKNDPPSYSSTQEESEERDFSQVDVAK